jgi:hypothetical protein
MPLLLQFSIALCTGMVAATFIPPVRRAIPRPVEVVLWIALIVVCAVGMLAVSDSSARNLTTSVLWGADHVLNTIAGLLVGGVVSWIYDHRFPIATWLLMLAGADLFALILLRSMRKARPWQPRVRLGEWMEMPVPVPATARATVAQADPLVEVNRRLAAGTVVLGAAMLAKTADLSIRIRNVMQPLHKRRLAEAANAGRIGSQARLESLRDAAAHLQYAAWAWYEAAGQPAVSGLAGKAGSTARAAGKALRPVAFKPGQVIDIQALLSAQSIGWYGPVSAAPTETTRGDFNADQSPKTDRLAS